MPVPSLFNLAKTRLVQNIHMLEDIGDLPYAFLAPVLRQIQIPDQLAQLEANCPQIQGETGEIWIRLIKRDIPGWDKKPHQPRDPKNWSKVYKKLKKEAAAEEETQQEALRQKMQALKKDRNGHQTTIINANLNLPSARRSGWSFGGGARSGWGDPAAPKKTGKMAFDKLKRGIYDAKRARPTASRLPQHILNETKRTVTQVPARMVRMAEAEAMSQAARRTPVPKAAPAPAPAPVSAAGANATRRPIVRQQPMPRLSDAAPERAERPRLPAGQQFSAPRPAPKPQPAPSGQSVKRTRTGPNILVESKRRRV
jgi:elongin-A